MHIFSGNALFKEQKCIYKKMIAERNAFDEVKQAEEAKAKAEKAAAKAAKAAK